MDTVHIEELGITVSDSNLLVVTTRGMFNLHVKWCRCQNAPKPDIQLFRKRLFPASFGKPKTAFTFDVLDQFHLDAMECKTSASSFHRKLQRLTNDIFPDKVPVSGVQLCPDGI